MSNFNFYSSKSEWIENEIVVDLKSGINDKKQLFLIYKNKLQFPDYFGYNWDALYDCLTDMSWIKNKKIIIIHHDIPLSNDIQDLKKYINLLNDVCDSWKDDFQHHIEIYFPLIFKNTIEKYIKN